MSNALGGYTKAQFIQDIKNAKAKGQHVIISVGGAEGTTYITNEEAANQFATSLISIIEEYGFEGVDIDFEGGAVSGTDYIAEALRTVLVIILVKILLLQWHLKHIISRIQILTEQWLHLHIID